MVTGSSDLGNALRVARAARLSSWAPLRFQLQGQCCQLGWPARLLQGALPLRVVSAHPACCRPHTSRLVLGIRSDPAIDQQRLATLPCPAGCGGSGGATGGAGAGGPAPGADSGVRVEGHWSMTRVCRQSVSSIAWPLFVEKTLLRFCHGPGSPWRNRRQENLWASVGKYCQHICPASEFTYSRWSVWPSHITLTH